MATIVDVAKRAGVSVSTVSYVLSGARPISEKTKERIYKAIEELDYHPNLLARGLATKQTRVIALLYPALLRNFSEAQLEFIAGAAAVATERGYGLLLWTSYNEDQEIIRLTRQGLVDGLVLMEVALHDPRAELLLKLGYPFSLIGHCAKNEGISFVDLDFDASLQKCVHYLAGLGHNNIAFLSYSPEMIKRGFGYTVRAHQGFYTSIEELGLKGTLQMCDPSPQKGYESMKLVLKENPLLSAVIFGNEFVFSGAIQAIQENNARVPEDISIIVITSPRMVEMLNPKVTSIDMPSFEMGYIGTQLLIQRLEGGEEKTTQLILPPILTVRASTGPFHAISRSKDDKNPGEQSSPSLVANLEVS